jgi:16S rRNA (cytidine1402-2'-O)-methyltransferase
VRVQQNRGVLYVVATPIGNLGDMTDRARKVLTDVDLIAAEDTRETRRLLSRFAISTPLFAYHEHNELEATGRLIGQLEDSRTVALVSDAGTPLISDPGYRLVAAARARDIQVVPIPGACAAICALSASGLPSDRFLFLGFPPRRDSQRRAWIESVGGETGTLVLYESGRRAAETLATIAETLGQGRRTVVARELTKRFETFLTGTAGELAQRLDENAEQCLGELTILVEGATDSESGASQESARVLKVLASELPLGQACALAAKLTGAKKNALYRLALELGLARPEP